MRISAINRIETLGRPDTDAAPGCDARQIELELRQSSTSLPAYTLIALSMIAIALLLFPVGLIAAEAATNPLAMDMITSRPGSTALLGAGILTALALLTVPLRAGASRLGVSRTVRIADGLVRVEDTGLTGTRRWSLPIDQFVGVTHHIRATISGARHEIILMHRHRTRDLLLDIGSRAPQGGAEHYAQLLGLPEIHARELYGSRRHVGDGATDMALGTSAV